MLIDIGSETDVEAHRNQKKLQSLIERVLADNAELKHRLRQSEDSFDACSLTTTRPSAETVTIRYKHVEDRDDDGVSILERRAKPRPPLNGSIIRFTFENVLQKSWVYRRNEKRHDCDISFASTAPRSHAWSVFSGYSLADISVLSVIAMPITIGDIENGQHYQVALRAEEVILEPEYPEPGEPVKSSQRCPLRPPREHISISAELLPMIPRIGEGMYSLMAASRPEEESVDVTDGAYLRSRLSYLGVNEFGHSGEANTNLSVVNKELQCKACGKVRTQCNQITQI